MTDDDDLDVLLGQEEELQLHSFGNDDAWRLGSALVEAATERLQLGDLAVDVRQPGGHLLGAGLVVPEVGRGGLLFQLGLVLA